MISRAQSETRDERLGRIQRQIADGSYETPEKLEAAIDAFLERHEADEDGYEGPSQPR